MLNLISTVQALQAIDAAAPAVLVTVLHTFPFVYLLASSALQSVDASYEEAAQILGLYRPTLYSKMKKHHIRDARAERRAGTSSLPH